MATTFLSCRGASTLARPFNTRNPRLTCLRPVLARRQLLSRRRNVVRAEFQDPLRDVQTAVNTFLRVSFIFLSRY